jgi:hypothetical protein
MTRVAQALIDVSGYPGDIEVPSSQRRINAGTAVDLALGLTCGPR